jgi:hypothetical protein
LYLFKPQAGRCLERENMSDGVRLAVFATIAESHGFNPWECVNAIHSKRSPPSHSNPILFPVYSPELEKLPAVDRSVTIGLHTDRIELVS